MCRASKGPPHGVGIPMTPGQQPVTRQLSVGGGVPRSLVKRKVTKERKNNKKSQKEKGSRPGRKNIFFLASALGTEKVWSLSHKEKEEEKRTDNKKEITTREKDHKQQSRN